MHALPRCILQRLESTRFVRAKRLVKGFVNTRAKTGKRRYIIVLPGGASAHMLEMLLGVPVPCLCLTARAGPTWPV
jgi:hypothetical protein